MKELFGFRNDIAHGKSIEIAEEQAVPLGKEDDCMRGFAQTKWEKFCTRQNAERAREDVERTSKPCMRRLSSRRNFRLSVVPKMLWQVF